MMAKFEHFNVLGPIYDRIFGRGSVDPILDLAQFNAANKVLDLGGGTGRVSVAIKPLVQSVYIGDFAIGMLRVAQSKGLEALMICSEYLPYPDCSFDRIVMVDAFHHLADQELAMKEMWRVVNPGGLILIEEPDINNIWVKVIALAEKILLMRSHFLSPEAIAQLGNIADEARVSIRKTKGTAWVIIRKLTNERGVLDGRNEC
jgi:ubiquinone/menaquinone biosynthesis C-methylase UbiE